MKKKHHRQWIKTFFIASALIILTVSGINYLVNPYNIFGHNYDARFKNKTEILSDQMTKFYVANRLKPKTIMLGTSRIGLFPENQLAPYVDGPIFNLGLPGSSIDEQIAYLNYMITHHHIKNVIWSLDFFSFNPSKLQSPAFIPDRLSDGIYYNDYFIALFNFKTLQRSFHTVELNQIPASYPDQPYSRAEVESNIRDVLHQYAKEKNFLSSEAFKEPASINPKIALLRKTIELCRQKHIACILYTSPVYYQHIDMIYSLGLGNTFEYWKKSLASIQPYTDFCTYSALSHDPMEFRDSSHVVASVGQRIFARIFNPDKNISSSDFGQTITPYTIDEHLNQQRQLRHSFSF